ncbi:hypothetical protein EG329_002535 [Mollisiaceae sp. DMI_Dod_QoI]|nr:hypothetical protein EG329_002535 [Helotiales sp. DMI_Dod_QoI]
MSSTTSEVVISPFFTSKAPSTVDESDHATIMDTELPLVYKEIRHTLSIRLESSDLLKYQKDLFLDSLSHRGSDNEPCSAAELTLQYLQFLLSGNAPVSAVESLLQAFERDFLVDTDIHSLLIQLHISSSARRDLLKTHFTAWSACGGLKAKDSALLESAEHGQAQMFAVFGGQGTSNPVCAKELSELYATYTPLLSDLIAATAPLLHELSRLPATRDYYYGRYIDVEAWMKNASTIPDRDFVSTAAVSFPILGLLGLAHYAVSCKVLGKTPGEMRSLLNGTTGHSQGIVVAAAIALSDSWESFYDAAKLAVEILFWVGYESHQRSPRSSIPADLTRECLENGEGRPSCMLSLRGIQRSQIEAIIAKTNKTLATHEKLYLALANARDNFVVAGPASSLVHLNSLIRSLKADAELDQDRTPYSRRKPVINHQFLPISAPFHTSHLKDAAIRIKRDLASKSLNAEQLMIPLYHSKTGRDLRELGNLNVIGILVDAITCELGDWPTATEFPNATHIVVLAGGGIGELTMKNKDGHGVRVIIGSEFEVRDKEIGSKADLFSPRLLESSTELESWGRKFQPGIMQSDLGEAMLDTKLSRLLGVHPVIVGGMTPTTVPWDFVSAVMNAGYHIEMAGGGYHSAESMSTAIAKVVASVPRGRGITCNLIYASPHTMAWQIAMLKKFAQSGSGIPIDGLTIGAGVPSPAIVSEYISTLGLKHIAFKPGSITAIKQVIDIANAHPEFPIILQWTGGRGGGHHSFEDFHAPILAMYSAMRKCNNLILVAGSGFGSSEDTYPYLTGTWTQRFGAMTPLMPFDGVLLGSRMMVAREAHTSLQAKELIYEAPGVADEDWEKTYSGEAGGVITVTSEMGQPIHKLATRGVRLWAELDKAIFSLPRKDRVAQLKKKRDYIIRKLNVDYAKPWFGQDADGDVVDLEDMTYGEVLARLVDLMYVAHQKRWVDASYSTFVTDFAARVLERLPASRSIEIPASTLEDPFRFLSDFFSACPEAEDNILNPEDVTFFLHRCKARGSKPVNFVPALDDDFETYFKKDSLWQSEDVDAVIGQDAGRVCILHGPVAARYSQMGKTDESAKDILDGIAKAHVDMIRREFYPESGTCTPCSEGSEMSLISWSPTTPKSVQALFSDKFVLQGHDRKPSPFARLLQDSPAGTSLLHFDQDTNTLSRSAENSTGALSLMKIEVTRDDNITVELSQPSAYSSTPVVLQFRYSYNPLMTPFGLSEVMDQRNLRIKSFYSKLWFGEDIDASLNVHSRFQGQETTLTRKMLQDLVATVGLSYPHGETMFSSGDVFPISIGIVVAWDVMTKPLVLRDIDGDLLRLVHQSNNFKYCEGAQPLRIGDVVSAHSKVKAVYIEDAGKYVVVEATIERSGQSVMTVTSTFLFKGTFDDFHSTFKQTQEPEVLLQITSAQDDAILRNRAWFVPKDSSSSLVGKSLLFRPQTNVSWKGRKAFRSMTVTGPVFEKLGNDELHEIGAIKFMTGECFGNPVIDFLERRGTSTVARTNLKNPGWTGDSSLEVQVPGSNEMYARVSRDYNPIHVSPIFSEWAELPGTITHGMYTSAIAAGVLEHLAGDGDRLRFRQFSATFTGMVLPSDRLTVRFRHTGMIEGRMIFKITAFKKDTDDMVLDASAEIEQATTAYVFTGQGSQSQGMGMDLYSSSPVAKAIWDEVDAYLLDKYGWSILDIVRNNPKTLTVHFGGKRGRKIRENYLAMTIDVPQPDGSMVTKQILSGLTRESRSYTFSEARGLLFSTQFAQPSILLLQKATFEDMRFKGVIQDTAVYAGHSLGEYGSLSAFSGFMSIKTLMDVVFYRGLTMQVSMERDEFGETNFSMVAVNPKRVGKFFDEQALRCLVKMIADESGVLLEIVNFNVDGEQYVCAGSLQNLYVMGEILNHISKAANRAELVSEALSSDEPCDTELGDLIATFVAQSNKLRRPLQLARGVATIPLKGIDVPFHSTHLRPGVVSYRKFLEQRITEENIHPDRLAGRWVPNVMAKPFSLQDDYLKEAFRLTQSPVLKEMLEGITV